MNRASSSQDLPRILALEPEHIEGWRRLRRRLWPDCPSADHDREMTDILSDSDYNAVFVALTGNTVVGFVEAALRLSAEDCTTTPVGYLEGWYADPEWRGRGVGAALVQAAEEWAATKGCREMASDAEMENEGGRIAHRRLGYQETSRLVHFRKALRRPER